MSRKKTPKKKAIAKKTKAARKKAPGKQKSRLGFDPLALDEQGVSSGQEEGGIHGIDALIRDTSSDTDDTEDIIALAAAEGSKEEPAEEEDVLIGDDEDIKAPGVDLNLSDEPEEPMPETQPVAEMEPEGESPAVVEKPPQARSASPTVEASAQARSASPTVEKTPAQATAVSRGADDGGDTRTFFSFILDSESYAIEIGRVKEVLEYLEPTMVPQTPGHMLGVINLRGSVIPVVSLRLLFGIPEGVQTVNTAIVIVEVDHESDKTTVGVMIDSVREVLDIAEAEIEPPARIGNVVKTTYISGMGKAGKDFVMILDVDEMLSLKELVGEE